MCKHGRPQVPDVLYQCFLFLRTGEKTFQVFLQYIMGTVAILVDGPEPFKQTIPLDPRRLNINYGYNPTSTFGKKSFENVKFFIICRDAKLTFLKKVKEYLNKFGRL